MDSTLMSGNTLGARTWSDSKQIAPMLPESPPVVQCGACGGLYWLGAAKEVGSVDRWRDEGAEPDPAWVSAPPVAEPTEEGYYAALAGGLAKTRRHEKTLRILAMWKRNDAFRDGPPAVASRALAPQARQNLGALVALLDDAQEDDCLLKAEVLRELGDFESAKEALGRIRSDKRAWVAQQLRTLCDDRDARLRELEDCVYTEIALRVRWAADRPPRKRKQYEPDRIQTGLSPEAAIAAFEAACKVDPNRLFITESWFAPFRARLLASLPASLTDSLVEALRDALYMRTGLETIVAFIEQAPTTGLEYTRWRADRQRKHHLEEARRGYFPWADVEAAAGDKLLQQGCTWPGEAHTPRLGDIWVTYEVENQAPPRSCPECGRGASELTWINFSSPAWAWRTGCGCKGWLVLCRPCRLQVDFFLDTSSRG